MKVGVRYWYNKGVALMEFRLPERAVECLDRALKDDPENPSILFKKGMALFYSDRLEEAADIFDETLHEDPENYSALNNMGMVLLRLNRIKEAEECFENAKKASSKKGCADLNHSLIKKIQFTTGEAHEDSFNNR
jgi:tetratricopeptide (TPR) repeat protein